jgi:hypothetical protein
VFAGFSNSLDIRALNRAVRPCTLHGAETLRASGEIRGRFSGRLTAGGGGSGRIITTVGCGTGAVWTTVTAGARWGAATIPGAPSGRIIASIVPTVSCCREGWTIS